MGSGDEVEATKTNGARVSVRLGIDVGKMGRNVSRSRINGPGCSAVLVQAFLGGIFTNFSLVSQY